MSLFHIIINSPDDTIYAGQVQEATLTTKSGLQSYLSNHWDSVAELEVGVIYIYPVTGQRDPIKVAVNGGFATFQDNTLTISTTEAEILNGRKPNLKLFPASISAKESGIEDEITQALKLGGVYAEDKSAIATLLAEERMAKVQLLNDIIKGY